MSLIGKLRRLFAMPSTPQASGDPNGLWFYVRCKRCGTVVRVRVHRYNDLNREEGPGVFLLHKEVMDSKCFQRMDAELWFDANYSIVEASISGGTLASTEEYEATQRH
jgi:hypothetical protein